MTNTITAVRPFGLTKTVPATGDPKSLGPVLTLCPQQQVSVTETGAPYAHAPSMKTSFTSQTQTREDSQLSTDTETDTD